MTSRNWCAAAVAVLGQLGCATIMTGTSQVVLVTSVPAQAQVTVHALSGAEVFSGITPTAANLSRKQEYTVTIAAPGYQPVRIPLTKDIETWVVGNFLCGGLPGGIVDLITGAFWRLQPEEVSVSLRGQAAASRPAGARAGLAAVLDVQTSADPGLYAVFHAIDSDGQARELAIPLVPMRTVAGR